MMKGFFGTDFADRKIEVKSGDTLSLGAHSLTFIGAPMVHWPEVMVAYDPTDKVLFSADGFGKFGAKDTDEPWEDEAARYYFGIVGKYGAQVQSLLKAASKLDIEKICALHGPVLDSDIGHCVELYDIWSSYRAEKDGVVIAYTSIYGHTKAAALELYALLSERGAEVKLFDLARCDMAAAVAEAFRYSKLVLATTTYNGDIFPFMKEFIDHLTERNYQGRTLAMIENGSWAPLACKVMSAMLEKSKNISYTESKVTIRSALSEQNKAELVAMADELCK
jgi:flavorubredoxin